MNARTPPRASTTAASAKAAKPASARRIPTPFVIAIASVLVSAGVVALVIGTMDDDTRTPVLPPTNEPDPGTPEGTALAFVNAWTTFRYERAHELSTGDARTRVDQTIAREAGYNDDQREIAEQLRQAMRSLRCQLGAHTEEAIDDGRTIVRATIRCTGAGSTEFERDDAYTLLRVSGAWRVAAWEPGTRRSL